MISPNKFARTSAVVGALAWVITLLFRTGDSSETELIQKMFLFAVFVIVPLAISIISVSEESIPLQIATFAQPIAALLCFASFLTSQGLGAGILVLPWFAVISLIALAGLMRLFISHRRQSFELSISAGMLYLPVGGAWLLASRLGLQPLGFGDTIVLLTAVHFHFAGFAAPVLAGLAGRYLRDRGMLSVVASVSAGAIVFGTPVVAAGITLSPFMALAGASIVTLGLTLLAILSISFVVPTLKSRAAQLLLIVASSSSLVAMLLAVIYAYSIVTHKVIVDIPHMAMTHGLLNSFGFAFCGLLAWALYKRATD
jgi:hypothetical protein